MAKSLRGGNFCDREGVTYLVKLTTFEKRRDRDIGISIWKSFSHVSNTYQMAHEPKRYICENEATKNCALDGTLRNTAYFPSALGNVNNVMISDLLAFVVMLLFSSICSHLKITCGGGVPF